MLLICGVEPSDIYIFFLLGRFVHQTKYGEQKVKLKESDWQVGCNLMDFTSSSKTVDNFIPYRNDGSWPWRFFNPGQQTQFVGDHWFLSPFIRSGVIYDTARHAARRVTQSVQLCRQLGVLFDMLIICKYKYPSINLLRPITVCRF